MNLSDFDRVAPSRVILARTPTPCEPLYGFNQQHGFDVWVKRDDLTGCVMSGNKIRKLEYSLRQALDRDADLVLACGGEQSNHCRATAAAAARLGLACRLFLRVPDPQNPPPLAANSLICRLMGAEIEYVTPDQYARRDDLMVEAARTEQARGRRPYIIPEGASNAVGAWGYMRAAAELAADFDALPAGPDPAVVAAVGSGGTLAGLILGFKLIGRPVPVIGVNVCDDADHFIRVIHDICRDAIQEYGLDVEVTTQDIRIADGYVGRGYALNQPEELAFIRDLARTDGLVLDPVYTGKTFLGLTRELEKGHPDLAGRVVFIHTGGLPGLMAKGDELAAVL